MKLASRGASASLALPMHEAGPHTYIVPDDTSEGRSRLH
jgi:hypothetical protein